MANLKESQLRHALSAWVHDSSSTLLDRLKTVAPHLQFSRHDEDEVNLRDERSIDERILEELREQGKLLRHLVRALAHNRILGGVMFQVETSPMILIAPGNSPQFGVTPTPAGVVTEAANAAWTSSDPTNAPVTMNADDPTGLSATVNVSTAAAVGSEIVLTWTYTNPSDGTVVTVEGTFPVVAAAPPPPTDVTGGTMQQIA